MQFLGPRPQCHGTFSDFIILLDLSYNSGENEVLFLKIGARVLDLWFDTSFGPKWPKSIFSAPDTKVKEFCKIS